MKNRGCCSKPYIIQNKELVRGEIQLGAEMGDVTVAKPDATGRIEENSGLETGPLKSEAIQEASWRNKQRLNP